MKHLRIIAAVIGSTMCLLRTTIILVLSVFSTLAAAGSKTDAPVVVSLVDQAAFGSVSTARYGADAVQYITCGLDTTVGNITTGIHCQAQDSGGKYIGCQSWDPLLIPVVQMINSTSWILFYSDGSGICSRIAVHNGSNYLP